MSNNRNGQATLIMLVLIIVIFVGMVTFLLSLAESVSQSEYLNLYAHGLLASLLRTDTGSLDANCKTVGNLLSCSFLSPAYLCGGQTCGSLAEATVNDSLSQFADIKEGFRYLLIVESEGFSAVGPAGVERLEMGDPSLLDAPERIAATQHLSGVFGGQAYVLNARLLVSRID
ncbi:MAG: hypothetical protein HY369_02710 [Candidatus Aenigmarchaeota archaeon]|nr:hypothetical protein [Candidatus Aenigmarchaeota archaeon]